ncbi:MAG: hypothetical protein Q7U16_12115 [Agitococcus sp.]|jgi:hypothetical protein|nr:hypothetical protein [Agitococcus sp.]
MKVLSVFLMLFSSVAYAGVYKCIKDNKVVFQDVECNALEAKGFGKIKKITEEPKKPSLNDPNYLPDQQKAYLCTSGSNFSFSEIKCRDYETSSNVKIEKVTGWGTLIPPFKNDDRVGKTPDELAQAILAKKPVQIPANVKEKVKGFKRLSGKYSIIQMGEYNNEFYKYTGEGCLKDFYFAEEGLILGDGYKNSEECSFLDWKVLGDTVSYKMQCVQVGKKASSRVSVSRNGLDGKFAVKVEDVAPSSIVQPDFSFELIYKGVCN